MAQGPPSLVVYSIYFCIRKIYYIERERASSSNIFLGVPVPSTLKPLYACPHLGLLQGQRLTAKASTIPLFTWKRGGRTAQAQGTLRCNYLLPGLVLVVEDPQVDCQADHEACRTTLEHTSLVQGPITTRRSPPELFLYT